jgi:prevent-host-death family protein
MQWDLLELHIRENAVKALIVKARDLKKHLRRYLRRVEAGESLIITSRGRIIGRLIPAHTSIDEESVIKREVVIEHWNGKPYSPRAPLGVNQGAGTISDLVVEGREPAWWRDAYGEEPT